MHVSIVTVFPQLHTTFASTSLIGRAQEKDLLNVHLVSFADFCMPKERIDAPICGPGAGMLMKPDVVERAIEHAEQQWGKAFKIFFSPQGRKLTQDVLHQVAGSLFTSIAKEPDETKSEDITNHLMLICGRYEGIDARVEERFADAVISIGDYVVMGGDLPAQIVLEGLLRLMPGVVGKKESVQEESFTGAFLDHPHYTLPIEWAGKKVPDIVLSGNHAAIAAWRKAQAAKKTLLNRFDWFRSHVVLPEDRDLARTIIPPHYIALLHSEVYVKEGQVGVTSVTSIDLHDIARSCATYNVANFFVVTPLKDQSLIVETFLKFWYSEEGKKYKPSRYEAVKRIRLASSFASVCEVIKQQEGVDPLVIATSAQEIAHENRIDFDCQGTVWKQERPVLLLFGTGKGLSKDVVDKSDYMLAPLRGLTDYNHLSVRCAAAVVLDRWLGVNDQRGKRGKPA